MQRYHQTPKSVLLVGVGARFALVASDSRSTREMPDGALVFDNTRRKVHVFDGAVVGLAGDDAVADTLIGELTIPVTPQTLVHVAATAAARVGWQSKQPGRFCSAVLARWHDNTAEAWRMAAGEWFAITREPLCWFVGPPGPSASAVVRRSWHEQIPIDEAVDVARRFIEETAAMNALAGGPAQIGVVDANGARIARSATR